MACKITSKPVAVAVNITKAGEGKRPVSKSSKQAATKMATE